MAKDDFTVQIENGKIMFMTSYRNEFGEECKVANIISKERLIEIHDNCNRALVELSKTEQQCTIHSVTCRLSEDEKKQGFIIKNGQKITPAIEQLCQESELNIQPQNDRY